MSNKLERDTIKTLLESLIASGDLQGDNLFLYGEPLNGNIEPPVGFETSEWGGRTIPEIEALREDYEEYASRLTGKARELFEGRNELYLPKYFVWNYNGLDEQNYPLKYEGVELDKSLDSVRSINRMRMLYWLGFGNFTKVNGEKSFIVTVSAKKSGDGEPVVPYHKAFGKHVTKEDIVAYYKKIAQSIKEIATGASPVSTEL